MPKRIKMNLKNRLVQLFKDNAEISSRHEIKTENDEATVYLYDAIGGWFGIIAEEFIRDFNAIEAKTIKLHINSPGGDVFDGRAIHTAVKQHPAQVTAQIDGLAASAATYIALAADTVTMAEGAFFMIHNAWTLALGDKNDMLDMADLLEKIDQTIQRDYQNKTGKDADEIKGFMDDESWFTADEALDHGFIDEIIEGEKVDNKYNLAAYEHAPTALTEKPDKREQMNARLKVFDRLSA